MTPALYPVPPILTIQDPSDVQGTMVNDCRPPLLPVSLQLSDIGPLSGQPTVVSASVAVPPWEDELTISGVGSDVLVVPELGVAPLVDSGTDLEDELPHSVCRTCLGRAPLMFIRTLRSRGPLHRC